MTQSLPGPETFQVIFSYKQFPPACNEHPAQKISDFFLYLIFLCSQ